MEVVRDEEGRFLKESDDPKLRCIDVPTISAAALDEKDAKIGELHSMIARQAREIEEMGNTICDLNLKIEQMGWELAPEDDEESV